MSESDMLGDDYDRVIDLIEAADNSGRVNDWERQFLADLAERVDRWGNRTFVSEKQWAIIERIEQKL